MLPEHKEISPSDHKYQLASMNQVVLTQELGDGETVFFLQRTDEMRWILTKSVEKGDWVAWCFQVLLFGLYGLVPCILTS